MRHRRGFRDLFQILTNITRNTLQKYIQQIKTHTFDHSMFEGGNTMPITFMKMEHQCSPSDMNSRLIGTRGINIKKVSSCMEIGFCRVTETFVCLFVCETLTHIVKAYRRLNTLISRKHKIKMRPLPPISGHCRVPVHRSICRLASSVCTICTT